MNDWTDDRRYTSGFYETNPSVKQQAGTLIVKEKIVKGTAGTRAKERGWGRSTEMEKNEIKSDQQGRQTAPANTRQLSREVSQPPPL